MIDALLSQYGGTLEQGRQWTKEPLIVVIRLVGCMKRRNSTEKEIRKTLPTNELISEAERMFQEMKLMKKRKEES